ncbi:MAG: hypothetical protein JWO04_1305 [Gammaproteobacteria bacterium]|nr:hypothetical protein [Gammaproteobacteria bacterium]
MRLNGIIRMSYFHFRLIFDKKKRPRPATPAA